MHSEFVDHVPVRIMHMQERDRGNEIRVHSAVRDSNTLGQSGENFKSYVHLNLQFLMMWREVHDNSNAEMVFWTLKKLSNGWVFIPGYS